MYSVTPARVTRTLCLDIWPSTSQTSSVWLVSGQGGFSLPLPGVHGDPCRCDQDPLFGYMTVHLTDQLCVVGLRPGGLVYHYLVYSVTPAGVTRTLCLDIWPSTSQTSSVWLVSGREFSLPVTWWSTPSATGLKMGHHFQKTWKFL